jgi:hypothetical protein
MVAYSIVSRLKQDRDGLAGRPVTSSLSVGGERWLLACGTNVSQRKMVPCEALQSPRGEVAVPSHEGTTAALPITSTHLRKL